MGRLGKLVEGSTNLLALLACILTVVMMLHIVTDVATKYLFAYQVEGTIEIVSSYHMVAIVFFPLAYVARHEGHIIVELFTRRLPKRMVTRLDGVMGVVTFVFMSVFAWATGQEAITRTLDGEVVQTAADHLIIWPSRWFLPIGCGVMAAYILLRLIDDFRRAAAGRRRPPAAAEPGV